MKQKTFINIFLALCSILFLTNSSCNPDPEMDGPTLTVQPSVITLEADGIGLIISVTSNTSWNVNANDSWLKYSPTGGTGGSSITVSASVNTGDERFSKLTLTDKTGRATVEVSITQKKADKPMPSNPILTVKPNSISFNSFAGSNTFTIESNTLWTVSCDQTWCTVDTSLGSNNATIIVNVIENTSTSARNATITVSSDKASSVQISISQSGASPDIQLNKNDMSFTAAGGSETFSVTSNTNWTVKSDQTWCTVSTSSGSNNGTITVSVLENTSSDIRSASITVEADEITKTISVKQVGTAPVEQSVRTFTVGGVQFKMIAIEGGTFTMGATSEQGDDARFDEKPAHNVTLSSYSIGETEVTQALWQAVMNSNPSYFNGINRPVEKVTWYDCQDFITKLNAITGENFRLPTEAEWEYAARGGNKSKGYKYAGSNTIEYVAWYDVNSLNKGSYSPDYGTHDVGTKQANELGLYDMSGNVSEWCQDWYGSYESSAQTNPTGPESASSHVYRGGDWYHSAEFCRLSRRGENGSSLRYHQLGFRIAL